MHFISEHRHWSSNAGDSSGLHVTTACLHSLFSSSRIGEETSLLTIVSFVAVVVVVVLVLFHFISLEFT